MYIPYQSPFASGQYQPRMDIIHVSGENGARAFQMPPNSSALLLDDTAPLIWLKMTDGAGYPTLTPYDITPHVEQTVTTSSLEERIKRLEDILNAKSNNTNIKRQQFSQNPNGNGKPAGGNTVSDSN